MAFSYKNKKGQTYYLHEQTVDLRGNNRKVGAAFIDVNDKRTFDLDVKVPADAKPGNMRSPSRLLAAAMILNCRSP